MRVLDIAVELTKITKESGAVTKRIHLDPDDTIRNNSSQCAIGTGRMTRLHLPDWRALAGLIEETPRNTAYALGALRPGLPDSVQLVRKRDPQSARPGVATRTAETILYKVEPSFVLCDFDTKGMPPDVRSRLQGFGGFRGALEVVCPAFAAAGHICRRSTSANLTNELTGKAYQSHGEHLYLLVQDGTDARRFLYALHDRCWLAGLGWHIVGKAGQLLERSIVDRMVCAPERLVFEADPDLEPPLRQEKREATVHDGASLDTLAECPDLNSAEKAELTQRKAEAARALGKECETAREAFIASHVEKAIAKGMDRDKARRMAEQWGRHVLRPGAVLQFDDRGEVDVVVILADPDRFDGATLADPIEGTEYGRNCAIVQCRRDGVQIYSYAHGGAIYKIQHDYESVRAAILAAEKNAAALVYARLVFAADLDPVEKKQLGKLAAKRSGVGVRDVEASARLVTSKGTAHKGDPARKAPDGSQLPIIKIKAGDIESMVDKTEAAVIAAGRGLYRRGGAIVRIGETEMLGADEKKTTALTVIEQSEYTLFEDASASAVYLKFDKRSDEWIAADPSMTTIKAWQGRATRLRLPLLSGVISAPLILKTGRIIQNPGYDAATGFYFDPAETIFPPIPETPTREDAFAALDLLQDLISEFPFEDKPSESVALSGFLTGVSRRALDFAFMHAVTAPAWGSGKSYLVDLWSVLATGREAPVISLGRSEEEFEKQLSGMLFKGVAVLAIDNIIRPLEGEKLCSCLTQRLVELRMLGSNKDMLEVAPDVFIAANGVNLRLVDDIRRRALLCSMDPKLERPEKKKFQKDPLNMVKADRGKYVAAALTIILAFIVAGRPIQLQPVNNYGRWCAMVRDALFWLGCADPVATMETIQKQDSRLSIKKQIAAHWKDCFGNCEKTSRQVTDEASRRTYDGELVHPDFYAALSEVAKDGKQLSTVRLGRWLEKNTGNVFSLFGDDPENPENTTNYRFVNPQKDRVGTSLWALECVENPETQKSNGTEKPSSSAEGKRAAEGSLAHARKVAGLANDGVCNAKSLRTAGLTLCNPQPPALDLDNKPAIAGRCAQCNGAPDGEEKPFDDGHGGTVLLHPECRRFLWATAKNE